MLEKSKRLVATVLFCSFAGMPVACGPVGGSDALAPAHLEVAPSVLKFGPDEDTESLLVKNTGGGSLTFAVQVSASSDDITWLKAEPADGIVEAGGAASVLVSVKNRDSLAPGSYQGKVVVTAEGLDPATVDVTLEVGQPVLSLEPSDVLDFGTEGVDRNLIIKNAGAGKLQYSITLPTGSWLTTDAVLAKEIAASDPQTVKFTVDRTLVPWYGDMSHELVITSTGLDDESHSSTAQLEVRVVVDPWCEVDSNCTKEGYYCNVPEGEVEGECKPQRENGQTCGGPGQCKSAFCVEGLCCDTACEGQCLSCAAEGLAGTCTPLPDGSACDDAAFCTDGDECINGICEPGGPMDCSAMYTDCSSGVCDEEEGGCVRTVNDDACFVDDECYAEGEADPELGCRECAPAKSQSEWTISASTCLIDGECHDTGAWLGNEGCLVCDPKKPQETSKAADGAVCEEDGNPCTDDLCDNGACTHSHNDANTCNDGNDCTFGDVCDGGDCQGTTYSCDDGLDCTEDICDGEAGCENKVSAGFCAADGECFVVGTPDPDSFGCSLCQPTLDQEKFTAVSDGTFCSDGNPCTLGDECQAGGCVGQLKACDDGIACTLDKCDPVSGECAATTMEDWCFIDSKCRGAGDHPTGADAACLVCTPLESQVEWIATGENQECDDLSVCSEASKCTAGVCTAVGPLCDDGFACTEDTCTENKTCEHAVVGGSCLIDGVCLVAGLAKEGSAGCLVCAPEEASDDWSPAGEEITCNDGLFCTENDHCLAGICKGEPKSCDDQLICTDDSCTTETGECLSVRMDGWCIIDGQCRQAGTGPVGKDAFCNKCDPDVSPEAWLPDHPGQPCDDLSECTLESVCDDGICLGQGVPCDDGNECTLDTCTAEGTCLHDNKDDQTPCSGDGVGCTADVCLDGACKHPPAPDKCVIDDQCYNAGDAAPGTICRACDADFPYQWTTVNEGGDCSDGEWCMVDDKCLDGVCTGVPRDCGGDQCNGAACLEDDDKCLVTPFDPGTDCDDLDPCTVDDACLAGVCESTPKDCSDLAPDNDCVQAFCDPASEPEPGTCKVLPAGLGALCDDDLYCNVGEECDGDGNCAGGEPRDCDEFGQCHTGYCSEDNNECVAEAKDDNALCNADTNGCTVDDYCLAGECKQGAPESCANVADTCNTGSCQSLAADNYSCVATPKGQGVQCNDDLFCTVGETCDGQGNCGNGEAKDCSDQIQGQQCVVAFCNNIAQECTVQTAPDGYVCNDGDGCTLEDNCSNGNCVGSMDGCAQRKLNTYSQGANASGNRFKHQLADLGQGDVLALWRMYGATKLRTRVVDRELSKGWWEFSPTGDVPGEGNCFNQITQAGLAARDNGDWIVAYAFRWGVIDGNNHHRRVRYRLKFAVHDKATNKLKDWYELYYAELYHTIVDWQLTCSSVPDDSSWGAFWPDGTVEAFAFSDGAFGVLAKVNQEQTAMYYPISAGFSVSSAKPIGQTHWSQVTGTALGNDTIALAWYNANGYALYAVVDRNMSYIKTASYAAQSGADLGHQTSPYVRALPGNRFVVSFNTSALGGPKKTYFQAFNSDGNKWGPLVQPYGLADTYQDQAPCGFDDGGAVSIWCNQGYDNDGFGIGATIHDSNLNTDIFPFQVNDVVSGNQSKIMCSTDGAEWLALWATNVNQTGIYDYYFKRFTKDGENAAGAPERRANQNFSGHQQEGAAAGTDSGFFMAWESANIDGDSTGISLRGFEPDGAPATMELQANQHISGAQHDPELAYSGTSGVLTAVWTSNGQVQGKDVFARLFDDSGTPASDEFQVNQTTTGDQDSPAVATVSDGDAVAVWSGDSGAGNDIYARAFDSTGQAVGNEFLVNSTTSGEQTAPRVLRLGDQNSSFIAAWLKTGGSGQSGVYARQFHKNGTPATSDKILAGGSDILGFSIDRHSSGVIAVCYHTGSTVSCRKVTSQLAPEGNSFQVGATMTGRTAVVVRDINRIWVARERAAIDEINTGNGIVREEVDFQGTRLRVPILVNWHEPAPQLHPFMTRLDSDDIVVGWESDGQDGNGYGVYYRVLD